MTKYKRILIRTDGSAAARRAVSAGLVFAKAVRAEVIGVHVRRAFTFLDPPAFGTAVEIDKIRAAEQKQGDRALAAFERAAREARVRFSTERAKGDSAWEAVLRTAQARRCDLIATTADTETGNLIANAKVAVLVVP